MDRDPQQVILSPASPYDKGRILQVYLVLLRDPLVCELAEREYG